jgi:hypothetical protein
MTKGTSEVSFWEHISESRLFCQPECAEPCHGCNEENELYDDFRVGRTSQDDELPIVRSPQVYVGLSNPELKQELSATLLPWADLNGNRKESLLTASPRGEKADSITHEAHVFDKGQPTRSLLPCRTGDSAVILPKPRFLSGIATKAYFYAPDATDPIDVELHRALSELDQEASMMLQVRCDGQGRYELDGRDVVLYWDDMGGSKRLLVHEIQVCGPSIADIPLQSYLRLVANIALDLQRPVANGVLSFMHGGVKTSDSGRLDCEDRFNCMRIACTQAKLREQEAEKLSSVALAGNSARRRNGSASPPVGYF